MSDTAPTESAPAATPDRAPSAAMQAASSDSTSDTEAAAAKMLGSIGRYVEGEAELSLESYRLLQSMNIATADRYGAIADYSAGLVAFAQRLQAKTDSTTPQLAQVDVMEQQVGELERAVKQLDEYSKRLEARFQQLAR